MSHSIREQNGASKSVYRLRLNVGLVDNVRWQGQTPATWTVPQGVLARAGRDARRLLETFGPLGGFRIRSDSSILVAHCEGTEPTVYVCADIDAGADLDTVAACIAQAVDALARQTTQEAIAWTLTAIQSQSATLENQTRAGCDGPNADAWRPFNPAYFVTLDHPDAPDVTQWAHA